MEYADIAVPVPILIAWGVRVHCAGFCAGSLAESTYIQRVQVKFPRRPAFSHHTAYCCIHIVRYRGRRGAVLGFFSRDAVKCLIYLYS